MHAALASPALVTPFHALQWTSEQLADAVPLRLHQVFSIDALRDALQAPCANHASPPARRLHSYLGANATPALFRVR